MTALSFTVSCSGDGTLDIRSSCGTVVIGMGECLSYVSDGCHLCALLVGLNASGSCTVVQWESASEFIVEEDGMPILHTCQPARRPSPFELLQVYDVETSFDIDIGQVMQKARVLGDKEWVTLCSSLEHGDIPWHTYFSRYMRVRQNTKQGLRKVIVEKHPMQPVDEFWGRWQLVFNKDEPMLVSTKPREVSEQSSSQSCTTFDEDRQYIDRLLWSSRLTGKAMSGKTPHDPRTTRTLIKGMACIGNPRHKMYTWLLRLCNSSRHEVVCITGTMGVGKTTVASALVTELQQGGKTVVEVNANLASISGKFDHPLSNNSVDVLIVEEYDNLSKQLLSGLGSLIKTLLGPNPCLTVIYIGNARSGMHNPRTHHVAFAPMHPSSMTETVQLKTAGLDTDMGHIEDIVLGCNEAHDMRQVLSSVAASRHSRLDVDRPCKRQRREECISSVAIFIRQYAALTWHLSLLERWSNKQVQQGCKDDH